MYYLVQLLHSSSLFGNKLYTAVYVTTIQTESRRRRNSGNTIIIVSERRGFVLALPGQCDAALPFCK